MDVNGKAGGLEMYLGEDVLTVDDKLMPVQWTGYIDGQKSYHGALSKKDKATALSAFRTKVKNALANPRLREKQDWTGIQAIIDLILDDHVRREASS